jgi:hypothetical protein
MKSQPANMNLSADERDGRKRLDYFVDSPTQSHSLWREGFYFLLLLLGG